MGSPSVCCVPQPGKPKSRLLLEAFAQGAGGIVADQPPPGVEVAFWGVKGVEPIFYSRLAHGGWIYGDNSYFDVTRGTHFRFARERLQATGAEQPDWKRFSELRLGIQPWRTSGRHVLVVVQSDYFMRYVARWPGGAAGWQEHVLRTLKAHTDRPIVVRHWVADKKERARTLKQDMKGAWVVVGHSTAAANEALIAGIPVIVTGDCAARVMGSDDLSTVESPETPLDRYDWAAALAGQQWTIEELRDGTAWRALTQGMVCDGRAGGRSHA